MKTTLEIPDDLFRRSKAMAALRGESLKHFVAEALRGHMEQQGPQSESVAGWRSVFGKARPEQVAEISRIVEQDLERVDPEDWR